MSQTTTTATPKATKELKGIEFLNEKGNPIVAMRNGIKANMETKLVALFEKVFKQDVDVVQGAVMIPLFKDIATEKTVYAKLELSITAQLPSAKKKSEKSSDTIEIPSLD